MEMGEVENRGKIRRWEMLDSKGFDVDLIKWDPSKRTEKEREQKFQIEKATLKCRLGSHVMSLFERERERESIGKRIDTVGVGDEWLKDEKT